MNTPTLPDTNTDQSDSCAITGALAELRTAV
jgi:hypothetical protein